MHDLLPYEPHEQAELLSELGELLQIEYDAVRAYDSAMNYMGGSAHRKTLGALKQSHARRIDALHALVDAHGGEPVDPAPVPPGPYTMSVLGSVLGGDQSILSALRASEAELRERYWRAASREQPLDAAEVLWQGAKDQEEYHTALGALPTQG